MSKQILTTWPEAATKVVVEKTLEEKATALVIEPENSNNVVAKKKKLVFIALIVILGIALVGGGVFAYRKAKSEKEVFPSTPEVTVNLTQTPEEPTPTPEPELERGELSIQVLNGSGEAGVASKAQKFLEDLGYEGVETDNADSYGYKETEISIKESKKMYLEVLIIDLETKYALATETGALDEGEDFDAVITIGEK